MEHKVQGVLTAALVTLEEWALQVIKQFLVCTKFNASEIRLCPTIVTCDNLKIISFAERNLN